MANINRVEIDTNSHSTAAVTPSEAGAVRVKMNEMLLNPSVYERDKKGRIKETQEYATISPELVRSTSRTLEDYAVSLIRLRENPDVFKTIMNDPDYGMEQAAIKLLTNEVKNPDTGRVDIQVSQDKIQALLKDQNARGWDLAMRLIEQQRILKQEAIGMAVKSMRPDQLKQFTEYNLKRTSKTGNRLVPSFFEKLRIKAEAEDAARKRAAGIEVKTNSSEDMSAAFDVTDTTGVEYFYAMTGIDPSEWKLNGSKLTLGSGVDLARSFGNLDNLVKSIDSSFELQRQFYRALGIPDNMILQSNEQGIDDFVRSRMPSQTGLVSEGKVLGQYKKLVDAEKLRREPEKQAEIQALSDEEKKKFFDADGKIIINIEENKQLELMMQARKDVLAADMQREIEAVRKGESKNVVSTLEAKIRARENDGAVLAEKQKALTEEQRRLEADKQTIQEGQAKLDSYKNALAELDILRTQLINEFGLGSEDAIKLQIEERQKKLTLDDGPASIAARETALTTEISTKVVDALTKLDTSKVKTKEAEIERANSIAEAVQRPYESRLLAIKNEKDPILAEIARLQELQNQIIIKNRELQGNNQVIREATKVVSERESNFNTIISWAISEDDLRNKTIEDLMKDINTVFAADNTKGWPKELDDLGTNRQMLESAIVQARSNVVASANFDQYIRWGFSANDLRISSPAEINKRMNDLHVKGVGGWAKADNAAHEAEVRDAMQFSRKLLDDEIQGGALQLKNIDQQIKNIDVQKNKIDVTKEVTQLEITKNLLDKQEVIMRNSDELLTTLRSMHTDEFVSQISVTDTAYTQEEKDAGYDKGYYVLMDYLFDYRSASDRGAQFKRIQQTLPQDQMIDLLASSFNITLQRPYTIDQVLRNISTQIQNGNIHEYNINSSLINVINGVTARAMAIS